MPRPPRIQEAGFLHHVVSIGNNRQTLFHSPKDFLTYLNLVDKARQEYPVQIYNFCLMGNHIHLLIEPVENGALSNVMEYVSKGYAKYFNWVYKREGHVFKGRFKSFLVQAERYFFVCSRYIDLNPVKAKLVSDPRDYRWSGYKTLAFGGEVPLVVDFHPLWKDLGKNAQERQVAYRALVFNYHGEELDLLERKRGVLGDKDFKDGIR